MIYATIIIISVCIILCIVILSSLRDNGNRTNDLRDNNKQSKDINRETSDIIGKLESENREAAGLNESIRKDNKQAGDIIKGIRKRGAIRKDK